ncbi:MAG: hypothetical protein FJ311_10850 [Rhodospirillales bacterium]|nr:hypothetical protein [Rhodospirillales bacterium]
MTTENPGILSSLKDSNSADEDRRDQAWVRVKTELSPEELLAFVQEDPERLLRINSMYEFLEWRGAGRDSFVFRIRNLANGRIVETTAGVERLPDGLIVRYGGGLKASTSFHVVPSANGQAELLITDDYSRVSEAERAARTAEVDNSLNWWGQDFYRYFRYLRRWSWVPGWRWYMERVWKRMKPMGRRVVYIFYVVTVVEIVAVILAVILFGLGWDEYFRHL